MNITVDYFLLVMLIMLFIGFFLGFLAGYRLKKINKIPDDYLKRSGKQ